jgi:hypothetical protein
MMESTSRGTSSAAASAMLSKRNRSGNIGRSRRLVTLGVLAGSLLGLWIAVHRVSWLGPLIADNLRKVLGVEAVAKLEDVVYGIQDRVYRLWRKDDKPVTYWTVPEVPIPVFETEAKGCKVPPFMPREVGAMHDKPAAPGDGQWVAIGDARHPDDSPRMYKTLLHPDKMRSWAALSVVAIDLRRLALHAVAGEHEPRGATKEAQGYYRRALVAPEHHAVLVAAFNGGFKAEHGHYGMRVDGVTLIPPRPMSCGVALVDDKLVIDDWARLKTQETRASWWRQTPACLVDAGNLHVGLKTDAENTHWGATVDGDTVIRRSALGMSADGRVLYVGIGDHVTAKAIAVGMQHAGSHVVAQLDVNWSFPKFLLYRPRTPGSTSLVADKLSDGFDYSVDDYIRDRSPRDFFYVTRKDDDEVAQAVCGSRADAKDDEPARDGARDG